MEKKLNKTISVVLPITYEIKQLRQAYPFYKYLIFCVEVIIFLSFPLQFSLGSADDSLTRIIKAYQTSIVYSKIFIFSISGLFLLFIVIFLLAFLSVSIKISMENKSNHDEIREKGRRFYLTAFVALQIVILPAFIASAWNIMNNTVPELRAISFIIFVISMVLVGLEEEKRLYQFSIITIIFFRLLTSPLLTNIMIFVFSIKRGRAERKQLYKKVVYYQFAFWSFFIFILSTLQWQFNYFYFGISELVICGLIILDSINKTLTPCEQNQKLMELTDQIIEDKQLSIQSKLFISKCFCSLKTVNEAQRMSGTQQSQDLRNFQINFNQKEMLNLLTIKIENQLKKQYSHSLKIQSLEIDIRFNKFSMKTLYAMQKLIEDIVAESTFEEKEKLYDLVNLTERKFLNKEDQFNAKTVINVQKYKEELNENIINIAIIMQQFWILHKNNRLNDEIISTVVNKVIELQENAAQTLAMIDKLHCVSQELMIFEYLKGMNDCSYQLIKKQLKTQDPLRFVKGDCNYIIVEHGNIMQMSNQLLNQFKLSKIQSQEYRLSDIVYEPISDYLNGRFDKIIELEAYRQNVNFILPLKISKQHSIIQSYNASIKILPELINGIKYFISLEKTENLEKAMILYEGKTDRIVGISKNVNSYLDLENEQFMFQQFCAQVNVLKLVQSHLSQITCQIKVRRRGKKLGTNKYLVIPVILSKVQVYQLVDNYLVLISIQKKNYFELSSTLNQPKSMFTARTIQNDRQKTVCRVNFCEIENPYEHLIEQKISKIQNFYKISYLKSIILLILILIVLTSTLLAILNFKISDASDTTLTHFTDNILINNKDVSTYSLYQESAILYQLKTYPSHFQAISPIFNISSSIQAQSLRVNEVIQTILNEGINEMTQPKFYDIVQDAKYFIPTNNITPLLNKWKTISKTPFSFSSIFTDLNIFFIQFQFLFVSALLAFLFFFAVICYLIQDVFDRILAIYQSMSLQQINNFIEDYRLFTHQLYESKYFKGVKANKYLQTFADKTTLSSVDQLGTFSYIENDIGLDMYTNEILHNTKVQNHKVGKKSLFSILCRQSYTALILIFFYVFVYFSSSSMQLYQKQLDQIAEHSVFLHQGRSNINFHTSFFLVSSLQQILPPSQRQLMRLPSQYSLFIQFQSPLPLFFSNYTATQTLMLNTNLCNLYLNNKQSLFRSMKCGQILDGVLTTNFAQATVSFNKIINTYLNRNMSSFNNIVRNGAKYSIPMEIIYSGKALNNLVTQVQKIFNILGKVYITISNKILGFMVKLGWILLLLFLIISRIFYNRQSYKCKILLKLFFILPKKYLLQMKVTKILKHQQILNCIQKLSF